MRDARARLRGDLAGEAIHTLVRARLTGRPRPAAAVIVIAVNRQAAGAPVVMRLDAAGTNRSGKAAQALTELAREAVEILAGKEADVTHIRRGRSCRTEPPPPASGEFWKRLS